MRSPCRNSLLIVANLLLANGFSANGASYLSKIRCSSQKFSAPSNNDHDSSTGGSPVKSDRRKGLLILTTVPFAWGTFEPAVRYVYALDPPLPGFVFSTLYYLVAAASLLTVANIFDRPTRQIDTDDESTAPTSPTTFSWPLLGGVELGLYLFLGNALQVIGLKTIEADRAAFLLQLTTLFVPLLQRNVSLQIWGSCLLALSGVGVMGLEGKEGVVVEAARQLIHPSVDAAVVANAPALELMPSFAVGDAYVIAAAVIYSFHCIRLEMYAKTTSAIRLAASKASVETLLSAFAATSLVLASSTSMGTIVGVQSAISSSSSFVSFCQESGREIVTFAESTFHGIVDGSISPSALLPAGLAILWTGWITCGYTMYAQSFGQRRVSPVTANLIYTIQPVCTAITAWAILGESLAPAGFVGGALIATAVLFVATGEDN